MYFCIGQDIAENSIKYSCKNILHNNKERIKLLQSDGSDKKLTVEQYSLDIW